MKRSKRRIGMWTRAGSRTHPKGQVIQATIRALRGSLRRNSRADSLKDSIRRFGGRIQASTADFRICARILPNRWKDKRSTFPSLRTNYLQASLQIGTAVMRCWYTLVLTAIAGLLITVPAVAGSRTVVD